MTRQLARMGTGFADPAHGAQQTFRVLLDAMSGPGRIRELPGAAIAGLAPSDDGLAPPMGPAMAAALLTLLDADTPIRLAGSMSSDDTRGYLRFHTGARAATADEPSTIVAALACDTSIDLCSRLALGTDEAPQEGATLIVEVDGLSNDAAHDPRGGAAVALSGPGVETTQRLAVVGLSDAFWRWRVELQSRMPRGVDILLVQGARLVAIPRSSRIESEA
jgi:alpha-D-ribose 1-methylphosphonate 5-triphosphate synthase subunit PhnH